MNKKKELMWIQGRGMKSLMQSRIKGELLIGTLQYKSSLLKNCEIILSPEVNENNLNNIKDLCNLKKQVHFTQLQNLRKEAESRGIQEEMKESFISNKIKKININKLINNESTVKWGINNFNMAKDNFKELDNKDLINLIEKKRKKIENLDNYFEKIELHKKELFSSPYSPTNVSHGYVGWVNDSTDPDPEILYTMLTSQKESRIFNNFTKNIKMEMGSQVEYINPIQITKLSTFKKIFTIKSPAALQYSKILKPGTSEEDLALIAYQVFIKSIKHSREIMKIVEEGKEELEKVKIMIDESILITEGENCILPIQNYMINEKVDIEGIIEVACSKEKELIYSTEMRKGIWDEANKFYFKNIELEY